MVLARKILYYLILFLFVTDTCLNPFDPAGPLLEHTPMPGGPILFHNFGRLFLGEPALFIG